MRGGGCPRKARSRPPDVPGRSEKERERPFRDFRRVQSGAVRARKGAVMPRKRTADVKEILRKRLEEPETAKEVAAALLSFLNAPDKAKAADVMKLLDFAAEGKSAAQEAAIPDPAEDFSGYTDAELWDWLKRLEGGNARAP